MAEILEFKASKLNITPSGAASLSGFMSRKSRVSEIHAELELNAHFFSNGTSSWVVISLDTLFITQQLKRLILDSIKTIFSDVKEENCWIAASHTHYAPSLETDRVELGDYDQNYFDFLSEQIPVFFKELSQQKSELVTLSLGSVKTDRVIVNRRRKARFRKKYFSPEIMMEEEIKGDKDELLHIMKVIRVGDEKVLGSMWTFACHPTNLPNNHTISSEFPGTMRDLVRKLADDTDLPTVFLQGFAGDIRAFRGFNSFRKNIFQFFHLSYPTRFYRFESMDAYEIWSNNFVRYFTKAWNDSTVLDNPKLISVSYLKENLQHTLGVSAQGIDSIIFRKISFDENLSFVSISAEVVSAYGHHVKTIFTDKNVIPVAYVDPVFGYLPTDQQICEGGYESQGYFKPFLIEGNFKNELEERIIECLKKLQ